MLVFTLMAPVAELAMSGGGVVVRVFVQRVFVQTPARASRQPKLEALVSLLARGHLSGVHGSGLGVHADLHLE